MDAFENKLLSWSAANGLFEHARRVLAAVSGGADSVVMAHMLHRLRQEGRIKCEFVIGHVNHGLRGADSDGDEAFVKNLGQRLGMEVVTASVPVRQYAAEHKLSIETAGRFLRLKALAAMAKENRCNAVAAAHHKDDVAETMIHRLMRGTGFRGLCGIRPTSGVYGATFIRPMLAMRRSEILRYADANELSWRRDITNRNVNFTRNRIRHRLLPTLQAQYGNVTEDLFALAVRCRRFIDACERQAAAVLAQGRLTPSQTAFTIERNVLAECSPWVFYEVMRGILFELNAGLRRYSRRHFDRMSRLIGQAKGRADFPGGIRLQVENNTVSVCKTCESVNENHQTCDKDSLPLSIDQIVRFGKWTITAKRLKSAGLDFERFLKTKTAFVEWFDADKIVGDLVVRQRRPGDRFWPIGAKAEKKVGRFLMDAGLDNETKRNALVIADAEKILWLAPIRMSEAVKVTDQTAQIVEIRVDG